MPRLLVQREHEVDASTRESYLASVASRRDAAKSAGANFWAFERADARGTFLEFTEAATLDAMLSVTPDARSLRLWREVEV